MEIEQNYSNLPKENYQASRVAHWNKVALKMRHWQGWGGYYHRRLNEIYARMIPQGARVLEIGCGNGDLLASLKPAVGTGVDISSEMVALAKDLHPELNFINESEDQFITEGRF